MNARELFETELRQRGFTFTIDPESGRHCVDIGERRMFVSLENLERDLAMDGGTGCVSSFLDAVVASAHASENPLSPDRLYWSLVPNDHVEKAEFRVAVSPKVDRVLVHFSSDANLVSWLTTDMLRVLSLSESDAGAKAFTNLARALTEATIETDHVAGVKLGYVGTTLPFKASLILAPNLREVVGPVLGWPLMAVVPDRDFLYLWAAQDKDFVARVGGVVVREYARAPYPISTEIFEINDRKVRAVGLFPTH